ncbi:MAG: aspartate aminotransferase [Rhodobacterales bacterium]|nr:MAG: aspartate aminotransferase [Rhodobacterales bacterium]
MGLSSATLDKVKPSPTIAMTQAARDLAASGRDVLSLTAGEPDFPTPPDVAEAAIEAIRAGKTRYTAVDGILELKEAVAAKWRADYGLTITPEQVSVSGGGKQVLFNALMATLDPGDEVIIPAPYWVSYPDMTVLCGGTPVVVPTRMEDGFRLQAADLAAAITARTKWLILNSPGNPTGAVLSRAELEAIAEVLRAHPHVHVICDDIYEAITFGVPFLTLTQVAPDLAERVLVVNGVSKGHAMTGWRIGYGVGPAPLIAMMRKVQSQSTSNPCSIAQWAAVAALTGPQDHLERQRAAYEARRGLVMEGLRACKGIVCADPDGAFYAFANIEACLGTRFATDEDFAMALLEEQGVGTVFGSAFGAPGHLRISFATSEEVLREALARLQAFCAAL